jgi:hypothetical protein
MNRRLDGKNKLVSFTAQQTRDMRQYCRENNIHSENELIRQAVVRFLDKDMSDSTLKLSSLKDVKENLSILHDMVTLLFTYIHYMHHNLLVYHGEIPDEFKDTAFSSAEQRVNRFYTSFQEKLKEDPAFFEKLLHKYVTGSLE